MLLKKVNIQSFLASKLEQRMQDLEDGFPPRCFQVSGTDAYNIPVGRPLKFVRGQVTIKI